MEETKMTKQEIAYYEAIAREMALEQEAQYDLGECGW
jgi:hypothetical protein